MSTRSHGSQQVFMSLSLCLFETPLGPHGQCGGDWHWLPPLWSEGCYCNRRAGQGAQVNRTKGTSRHQTSESGASGREKSCRRYPFLKHRHPFSPQSQAQASSAPQSPRTAHALWPRPGTSPLEIVRTERFTARGRLRQHRNSKCWTRFGLT